MTTLPDIAVAMLIVACIAAQTYKCEAAGYTDSALAVVLIQEPNESKAVTELRYDNVRVVGKFYGPIVSWVADLDFHHMEKDKLPVEKIKQPVSLKGVKSWLGQVMERTRAEIVITISPTTLLGTRLSDILNGYSERGDILAYESEDGSLDTSLIAFRQGFQVSCQDVHPAEPVVVSQLGNCRFETLSEIGRPVPMRRLDFLLRKQGAILRIADGTAMYDSAVTKYLAKLGQSIETQKQPPEPSEEALMNDSQGQVPSQRKDDQTSKHTKSMESSHIVDNDRDDSPRHPAIAKGCLPHVVLGGFAKCATSSLHKWVVQHPNIIPPLYKEPNFDFDPNDEHGHKEYRDWLTHYAGEGNVGNDGLTIDSSTHLFWNVTHLKNLKRVCPNSKFIVVVCDPVKRIISHWNYRKYVWEWEFLTDKDFEQTVLRQLEDMPRWLRDAQYSGTHPGDMLQTELDADDSHGLWMMVREGVYAAAIMRFLTMYPSSQLLVINNNNMFDQPLQTMRTIERFLGLPHHSYPERLFQKAVNQNRMKKDTLSEATTQKLYDFYKPHNDVLEQMLGIDVSSWTSQQEA